MGFDVIKEALRTMPGCSGVYRMLDAEGNVLYVGKAKHLKNRVGNYASSAGLSTRILRMISLTQRVEITTTPNEAAALLLEANLIKQHKPRYNILLRDDKSFPYLSLTRTHPFPQIAKYRGAQLPDVEYFGPFASVSAVNETLTLLQRLFLLRPCSDYYFAQRTRPCLQYQIKRCSAPCVGKIAQPDYAALVQQARRFLQGKSRDVQADLQQQMQEASQQQHYEKAAQLRDRIATLTRIQQEQALLAPGLQDADVIALAKEGGVCCVQVFFFRAGQHFGNQCFFPEHAEETQEGELLAAFLGQFYTRRPVPEQILVSHALAESETIAEALSQLRGSQVEIHLPQRGEKKEVLARAEENARMALSQHLGEKATQQALLLKLAELFALPRTPEIIEVYDNSHISGTHRVGGMICASSRGFEPSHYRRFTIRGEDINAGDDLAMMDEVLTRRFARLQKEDASLPDLVLIDGGETQLRAAQNVFERLGITTLAYAAIAKGADRNAGREWFHLPGRVPFQLPQQDPLLHYLQRLRDEAHRYAIGTHRDRRSKAIRVSGLDVIPGVGATRKRALLRHFGSMRGVEAASLQELMQVEGVNRTTAETIYRFFRG